MAELKDQLSQEDVLEKLATEIRAVEASAKKLLSSSLNRHTLALLIKDNLARGIKGKLNEEDILAVLDSTASLSKAHLKPK